MTRPQSQMPISVCSFLSEYHYLGTRKPNKRIYTAIEHWRVLILYFSFSRGNVSKDSFPHVFSNWPTSYEKKSKFDIGTHQHTGLVELWTNHSIAWMQFFLFHFPLCSFSPDKFPCALLPGIFFIYMSENKIFRVEVHVFHLRSFDEFQH